MKIKFPTETNSQLQIFAQKVCSLLVDNFPQTFYVGGMVRDILLNKPVIDIDIATQATPDDIEKILTHNKINFSSAFKQFGVIVAKSGSSGVEIATLRTNTHTVGRYPKITFTQSPKIDSQRRDFSINALYLSQKSDKVLDFHKGLADIKSRTLRFIGNPTTRIKEDPLRIIRALRFALVLNFKIDSASAKAIENNFYLIGTLTKSRLENEFKKIKNPKHKKIIQEIISIQKLLDINVK